MYLQMILKASLLWIITGTRHISFLRLIGLSSVVKNTDTRNLANLVYGYGNGYAKFENKNILIKKWAYPSVSICIHIRGNFGIRIREIWRSFQNTGPKAWSSLLW